MANEQRVHPRKRRKVCAFCVDKATSIDYKDTAKLRLFNLAGISLWLIYGIFTLSMSTIVGNVVYITSILITMIRVRGEAND